MYYIKRYPLDDTNSLEKISFDDIKGIEDDFTPLEYEDYIFGKDGFIVNTNNKRDALKLMKETIEYEAWLSDAVDTTLGDDDGVYPLHDDSDYYF